MANLRKTLTKLPHLITFEAASRTSNFTEAAMELGVTRVSVSRQIADLEAVLGVRLFYRNHRTVSLTQAGSRFAADVGPSLHQIANAVETLTTNRLDPPLTITTTSAFSTYWLMPRLGEFSTMHPDIELNLVVTDRKLDLSSESIDIAIRYSKERPKEGHVTPFLQERIFPVRSPKYIPRTKLSAPNDLMDETLLHLSGVYRPGARWHKWFENRGVALSTEGGGGLYFNTYINMLQAAIEGQGIALAGSPLINTHLEKGELERLDGFPELERYFFHIINRSETSDIANAFVNWLLQKREMGVG